LAGPRFERSTTVIDAVSRAEVRTIDLPGSAEFAASDGKKVIVNLEDKNSVAVIDLANDAVTTVWPLNPCEGPAGLALDAAELACSRYVRTIG
jgi:DNA-binding beta-propeller fold protein YncE